MSDSKRVLVTGATGYIGGRLLPLLAADVWRVRCLARQPGASDTPVSGGFRFRFPDLDEALGHLLGGGKHAEGSVG